MSEFTMESFGMTEESSTPTETATTTETTVETSAESTETTPEVETTTEAVNTEETPVESNVYEPNFSYEVKGESKEFPEFLRAAITSKENEDELRDMFTKLDGFDGIKESRAKIEEEFNTYKTGTEAHFNEKIMPTLQKIGEFDHAVATGNLVSAMEMANMKPEAVIDALLVNDKLSSVLFTKAYEMIDRQEQGPQAVQAYKASLAQTQEKSQLELQNQTLTQEIAQLREAQNAQALDFALAQSKEHVDQYESFVKTPGAFRGMVETEMKLAKFENKSMTPMQAIEAVKLKTGLMANNPQVQTNVNQTPAVNVQDVQPQVTATPQPAVIPNLGAGVNQSVVSTGANTMEAWKAKLRAAE